MIKLGTITLGDIPRVAVALRDGEPLESVNAALDAGADLLEFRIDQFKDGSQESVIAELKRFAHAPILATIRCSWEGGDWQGDEATRLALFQAILPYVDAIDVELSASEILLPLVAAAHEQGKLIIGSYHHFEHTPGLMVLSGIAGKGRASGVDIVKVACHCEDNEALQRLASFTLSQSMPVITSGMGVHGMMSRVFLPALGSLITYTFLGAPSAPGQLNYAKTVAYLNDLYPDRKVR